MNALEPISLVDLGPPQPELEAPRPINVKRLVRRLLWGLPIMFAGGLIGAYGGIMSLRVIPPTYTSSVALLIDPRRPGSYGADTDFSNTFVDASKIANVELVLRSSSVLERVVNAEHLADDPFFGAAQPSLLEHYLPALAPKRSPTLLDTPELRKERAIERLRGLIKTSRIGVTYVVTIDVSAGTAEASQKLATDVANAYMAEQLDSKLDATVRDTSWLNSRIKEQRDALTRSSGAVEDLRKQLGVTRSESGQDFTVERDSITAINQELGKAEAELAIAQARYEQAAKVTHDGGGLDGLAQVTDSPVIAALRGQQATAEEHVADLAERYGSGYPLRRQAQQDLAALNRQVALEVSRITARLHNDYQTALTHRDVLKQQLDGLVGKVNEATAAEGRTELREAERVVEADKVAYEASLNRLRDVEQQQTRQDTEARIISTPDLPERPSFPKPIIIIPAAGMLGLLFGAAIAFRPRFRNPVDDPTDAEYDLALPVLVNVPYISKSSLNESPIKLTIPNYLMLNPFSSFGESLRLLRLRLSKSGRTENQVIQITSAVKGEGKSTIAASLAISAASAGIRTVLVDLDLHHPESGRLLGMVDGNGVVELLKGSVATAGALRAYKDLPLRAITAGSIANLHPSMIESSQLRELIAELRQEFDFIVLDTPPVLAISDPLYIANLVDATVLVAAWRGTPQALVADAVRTLRNMHAPLAGLLMNKVNQGRNGTYGNYYGNNRRYITASA